MSQPAKKTGGNRRKRAHKGTILIGAALAGVVVAVASGWIFRGCEEYNWAVIGICGVIGVPTLMVAWIQHMLVQEVTRPMAKTLAVGCFALLQAIGLFIGNNLYANDVRQAKKFCESLVPTIENVKKQYGRYPQNLEKIVKPEIKLPRLIVSQSETYYWASSKAYGFSFNNPRRWAKPDKLCFSSDRKEWYNCPAERSL